MEFYILEEWDIRMIEENRICSKGQRSYLAKSQILANRCHKIDAINADI